MELRSSNPLLPLGVVLNRNRGGSYLASLLVSGGLYAMFLFLTYYFQLNLRYSPLKSGFAFLPFSAGIIFAAVIAAQLIPRIGPKPLMMTGSAMAAVGLFSLTFISQSSSWLTHVLPGEILLSLGLGWVFVPLSSLALIGVGHHDAGVASAMLNTSQQIGGTLGTSLLSTFFAGAVTSYISGHHAANPQTLPLLASIHGYHVAFYVGVGLLVAAFLVITLFINAGADDLPTEGASLPERQRPDAEVSNSSSHRVRNS